MHGRVACARLLLERGAASFLRTSVGRTAQDIARQRDQVDITALFPSRSVSEATLTRRQSRQSSRTSLHSFFSSGGDADSSSASDDSDSNDDSYSGRESSGSDLERRLSRNPSMVSLPAHFASEEEDQDIVIEYPTEPKAPKAKEKPLASTPQPSLFDVAAAYSTWLADALTPPSAKMGDWSLKSSVDKMSEKMPAMPTFSRSGSFSIAAFPVNTPHIDPRTWFAQNDKGKGKETEVDQTVPQFWRPFDQYFKGSKVTEVVPAQPESVPLYPPAPQEAAQRPLALRASYISDDIGTSVLQAVTYQKERCQTLARDRRLFVIWLPAILLAIAYFFYALDLKNLDLSWPVLSNYRRLITT